jgi:hypothetical protein
MTYIQLKYNNISGNGPFQSYEHGFGGYRSNSGDRRLAIVPLLFLTGAVTGKSA